MLHQTYKTQNTFVNIILVYTSICNMMNFINNTIFIYKSFSKSVAYSPSTLGMTASTLTERFVDKNCIVDKIHVCVNLWSAIPTI